MASPLQQQQPHLAPPPPTRPPSCSQASFQRRRPGQAGAGLVRGPAHQPFASRRHMTVCHLAVLSPSFPGEGPDPGGLCWGAGTFCALFQKGRWPPLVTPGIWLLNFGLRLSIRARPRRGSLWSVPRSGLPQGECLGTREPGTLLALLQCPHVSPRGVLPGAPSSVSLRKFESTLIPISYCFEGQTEISSRQTALLPNNLPTHLPSA